MLDGSLFLKSPLIELHANGALALVCVVVLFGLYLWRRRS